MNKHDKIAVCSRSFSNHQGLRNLLLQKYKNVKFNNSTKPLRKSSLIKFLKGHNKAITALEKLDRKIFASLPELKVVSKYGVGLDMIDINAMRKFKIRLGWTPGVNRRSAAELTLGFAIIMLRNILAANQDLKNGIWRQMSGRLLSGKTFGIIGCGNIGKDLVKLIRPFGCKILVYDIKKYPSFFKKNKIKAVSLDHLLSESDLVSLHLPFNKKTKNIISKYEINKLKPKAILLNVARGGLVDENALQNALKNKKIAAAACDVFSVEPPKKSSLLTMSNFLATPHIGGSSEEAILAMGKAAILGLTKNSIPKSAHIN